MIRRGAGEFGAAREARDDGDVLDLAALERLQEGVVVLERHTSVRIAVRPQHVAMGEDAVAPENSAADGREPERLHPMEELLPRREVVEMRRRRAVIALIDMELIVLPTAE